VVCTDNPCRFTNTNGNSETIIVLYNGRCVELGSQCGDSSGGDYYNFPTIRFVAGTFEVECATTSYGAAAGGVGGGSISSLKCSNGFSRWSYATGMCKKTVSYAFS